MKKIFFILLISLYIPNNHNILAQCNSATEIELTLTLITGNFGSDTGWEIIDSDNNEVYATDKFYGDQGTFIENICVPLGANITFNLTCCFDNDGSYHLEMLGLTIIEGANFSLNRSISFQAIPPSKLSLNLLNIDFQEVILTAPHKIKGQIQNLGLTPLTSFEVNFEATHLDNNKIYSYTENITNLNINTFSLYDFELSEKWLPQNIGNYDLKIEIISINNNSNYNGKKILNKKVFASKKLAKRMVLSEGFSNASCSNCALTDPSFAQLINSNLDAIAPINYHAPFPGFDQLYFDNQEDADGRVAFYEIEGTPRVVIEGGKFRGFTGNLFNTQLQDFKQLDASINISISESLVTENQALISVHLEPYLNKNTPSDSVLLQVVIVEAYTRFDFTPPGNNGLQDFIYTMRKMLPTYEGTMIDLGEKKQYNFIYDLHPNFNSEQLRTIVFLQKKDTKEILQAFRSQQKTGTNQQSNLELQGGEIGRIQVEKQAPSCANNMDGRIEIKAIEGATPFTYLWETGENTSNLSNIDGSRSPYQVTITDANGLSTDFEIYLPTPPKPTFNPIIKHDLDGTGSGSLTLQIEGGQPPFSYLWSNGDTTNNIGNLFAGIYDIFVTDMAGCDYFESFTIENQVTNINVLESNIAINLYPNPANNQLFINLNNSNLNTEIQFFDTKGNVINVPQYDFTSYNPSILSYNIEQLSTGLYFVKVKINKQNQLKKLFIK